MASIVLLLSELLGGESASVLAADRYIMGGRLGSLGEFRPAVTSASAKVESQRSGAGTEHLAREEGEKTKQRKEESFEDLAVSRIAVDVMWP